jgi:hypothetical protein
MVIFLLYFSVALVATFGTHHLAQNNKIGSVRASSLLTLAFCLITYPISYELIPSLQAAFFGASFVGMASPTRLSKIQLFIASIVFSFIYVFLIHHLKGIGGALGFSAFVSCLITQIPTSRKALLKFLPRR